MSSMDGEVSEVPLKSRTQQANQELAESMRALEHKVDLVDEPKVR